MDVVACYVEVGEEVLYLERQDGKTYARCWDLPGGKVGDGELPLTAIQREVFEETGIDLQLKDFEFIRKVYVRLDEYDFEHYMFRVKLPQKPRIKLSAEEHRSFTWITPKTALTLLLVPDEEHCIRFVYASVL